MLALLIAAAWMLREPLRRGLPQRASIERGVLRRLGVWRVRRAVDPRPGALVLGDSLLICGDGTSLARLLADRLAADGRTYDMLSLAHPAFRPITAYYLLDEILAAHPALVVVGVNLRVLGVRDTDPSFRFAGLSRRLSWRRARAVREALAADELGPLAPPLYRLEERLDLLYVADGIRELGRSALDAAGWWTNRRLGTGDPSSLRGALADVQTRHDEYARRAAIGIYATAFASSPQAVVMRLIVEELRAAGTDVLLYVSPVNVDYLAALGLSDQALGLPRRLEALRRAVGATPAEWLDLHATESADGFHDTWNHLERTACDRVASRVAAAIANRQTTGRAERRGGGR